MTGPRVRLRVLWEARVRLWEQLNPILLTKCSEPSSFPPRPAGTATASASERQAICVLTSPRRSTLFGTVGAALNTSLALQLELVHGGVAVQVAQSDHYSCSCDFTLEHAPHAVHARRLTHQFKKVMSVHEAQATMSRSFLECQKGLGCSFLAVHSMPEL